MTSPYGDLFPKGETYPHPDNYPLPEAVGRFAMVNALEISSQNPLNFDLAEMHMRAFAGLFNGPASVDELMYNRLSAAAKTSSKETADAAYSYFKQVGLEDSVYSELDAWGSQGATRYQQDRTLINMMQIHTSIVGRQEDDRQRGALRRGLNPGNFTGERLGFPSEDSSAAELERLQSPTPYSMEGIRSVVRVYGRNLGPFIEDFYANAPTDIDRRMIVHHAYSSLQAARPRY